MRKLLFIISGIIAAVSAQAQVELIKSPPQAINGEGKIYALIIGISDYENIRDLNYADNDAQDFYNFLVKESGLKVDSNNVRLLLNKNATSANVGKELLKLRRRMEPGSTFFIYFAGHGDANGEAQAYLLAHDLPPVEDPSLYSYNPGVIPVYTLKDDIRKTIAEKNVKVVLVTDACRTNELAGSTEGAKMYVNKIMEQNSGEIQFISCAADEKSEESDQWGEGRGVFSYYFMNGLRGLADTRPADGKVTVRELYDYVQRNVEEATTETNADKVALTGKAFRQSPQYCCTEKQNIPLVLVDEKLKQQTIAKMATVTSGPSLASNRSRSSRTFDIPDSTLKHLYENFYTALDASRLVSPRGQSAWDYYTAIKNYKSKKAPDIFDATEDIKAALLNDAQKTINSFYSYTDKWGMSDKTKREFYNEGVEKLSKARSLMMKEDPLSPVVQMTRQCMEAAGLFSSSLPDDWRRGIKIMDSAIAITPKNALPVFLKGRLQYNLGEYENALENLRKSQSLAPRWSMPQIGIADVYMNTEMYDSAEAILLHLAETQEIALVYFKLGYFYGDIKGNPYNGVYYSKKAHALAPEKANAINNIGAYYEKMGEQDSALYYYEKSFSVDSNNAFTLKNMGSLYMDQDLFDKAEKILEHAIKVDSIDGTVYENLGILYGKESANTIYPLGFRIKYWKKSVAAYEKAVQYKPTERRIYINKAKVEIEVDADAAKKTLGQYLKYGKADADYYNECGLVYLVGYDTASALDAFHNGIKTDKNYYYPWFNIGEIYHEHKMWDSALKYYEKAHEIDPSINNTSYRIETVEGYIEEEKSKREKDAMKAQYRQRIVDNNSDWEAKQMLADMYYEEYHYDSAYTLYLEVVTNNYGAPDYVFLNFFKTLSTYNWEERDTAMEILGRAAKERKNEEMAYQFIYTAKEYNDTKQLPKAEELYAIISAANPGYESLSYMAMHIAVLHNDKGNDKEALKWLETALEKGYFIDYAPGFYFKNKADEKKYNKLIKKYTPKN